MVFFSMIDARHMKRALALAKRALGRTSPNPVVGAVLVSPRGRGAIVLAEDYHRSPGSPHAEALVLRQAGRKARGATLYVTLEPCCHKEKRTPPCSSAIIASGVTRVVVAMKDPNPKVSGKGLKQLRRAGIEVITGVLEEEAGRLNEAYVKFITTGRPFVTLKTAMTLDGKIATPSGESRWITGERSRALVHSLRGSVGAIITAVGTVRADDPELTARLRGKTSPVRIVIDPYLKIPLSSRVLQCPPETYMVTQATGRKRDKLVKSGIKVINYKGTLKLKWLLTRLGRMGISSVLIEGGSSLNAHALMEGVVDKVMYFIAPKIMGGLRSYPAVGGDDFKTLAKAIEVGGMRVRRIGEDILVEGYIA